MKIHLSADYESEIWFYAACSQEGHLTAIELATQFVHESAPITLPQDVLLPQLDETQRLRLLQRQVSLLEKHQTFFETHNLLAFMPTDEGMASTLLESEFLTRKIKQLPFLRLDISETFLSLHLGKNNPLLAALYGEFKLSLSHFGAGNRRRLPFTIICLAVSGWINTLFSRLLNVLLFYHLCKASLIISVAIAIG